jgi:hypothetical protein
MLKRHPLYNEGGSIGPSSLDVGPRPCKKCDHLAAVRPASARPPPAPPRAPRARRPASLLRRADNPPRRGPTTATASAAAKGEAQRRRCRRGPPTPPYWRPRLSRLSMPSPQRGSEVWVSTFAGTRPWSHGHEVQPQYTVMRDTLQRDIFVLLMLAQITLWSRPGTGAWAARRASHPTWSPA